MYETYTPKRFLGRTLLAIGWEGNTRKILLTDLLLSCLRAPHAPTVRNTFHAAPRFASDPKFEQNGSVPAVATIHFPSSVS
jgi:hypothetical protein